MYRTRRLPSGSWNWGARASRPSRTFLYEFGRPSPVQELGACHALEFGFVFDTLNIPESHALTGPDAPQDLAITMHHAWVSFAATGDPGWTQWNAERPVMLFDADGQRVVRAPREAERRLWR
ncbi:carboxylesterase/lipase family protein [Streptomyces sasae]|uniref:hypothetical protein n=1 Tax=Streptomyces sasae TaxID=1266772 RepID=UPI002930BCC3|nr:hypothetical protein [Streptomyces sasae]